MGLPLVRSSAFSDNPDGSIRRKPRAALRRSGRSAGTSLKPAKPRNAGQGWDTMADHITTLPTLIDTSRRRLSTVAPLADIPEEAARR